MAVDWVILLRNGNSTDLHCWYQVSNLIKFHIIFIDLGAFRSFIFQHILQVERELDRLIIQIHKAVQDKSQFFQLIYEVLFFPFAVFQSFLRAGHPYAIHFACFAIHIGSKILYGWVWSHWIVRRKDASLLTFVTIWQLLFIYLIQRKQNCNFRFRLMNFQCIQISFHSSFFSTAISAVLMNQLTWVASVAPREKCPTNSRSLLLGMVISK